MTSLQDGRGESLEIRNDVLDHLMQAGLSGTECSLALVVIQALSRHGKTEVPISLREFHGLVRLDQEAIRKGIKTLREPQPHRIRNIRPAHGSDCHLGRRVGVQGLSSFI